MQKFQLSLSIAAIAVVAMLPVAFSAAQPERPVSIILYDDSPYSRSKHVVTVDYRNDVDGFILNSAGLLRAARLLAKGELLIPDSVWHSG